MKNVLFFMLACFVFMLAGCGDNGSAETSYVDVPVKSFDPVTAMVHDSQNLPFEGAGIVLRRSNGAQYSFPLGENVACDFGKFPYGNYTVEIPGYSNTTYTDFLIDDSYTSKDLTFARLPIDITVVVNGFDGDADDLGVSISDGFNMPIDLGFDNTQQSQDLFKSSGVPAGRYYLGVYDISDPAEHVLIAYQTIDVNASSTNFPITVLDTEITYATVGIPVSLHTRIKATLDGKKADGIYWNKYYAAYTAQFVIDGEKADPLYRLEVIADGFKDFSKDCPIRFDVPYVPMITPLTSSDTVAIHDFIIQNLNEEPLPQELSIEMTVNEQSPDDLVYVSQYMNKGELSGVYIARYYFSKTSAEPVPYTLTVPNYEPHEHELESIEAGYHNEEIVYIEEKDNT